MLLLGQPEELLRLLLLLMRPHGGGLGRRRLVETCARTPLVLVEAKYCGSEGRVEECLVVVVVVEDVG